MQRLARFNKRGALAVDRGRCVIQVCVGATAQSQDRGGDGERL